MATYSLYGRDLPTADAGDLAVRHAEQNHWGWSELVSQCITSCRGNCIACRTPLIGIYLLLSTIAIILPHVTLPGSSRGRRSIKVTVRDMS